MATHGHMQFSPPSGGSGTGPPSRPPKPSGEVVERRRAPSADYRPVPIALNLSTVLKLTIPALLGIVGTISAAMYFFHQTKVHMANPIIHLEAGERDKLETKHEAKHERGKMIIEIKKSNTIMKRELKVDQREQIETLGNELKLEQRRILTETRRIRRAVQ